MVQRASSSSSRVTDDCCVININQQPQTRPPPRRRTEDAGGFLRHNVHQSPGRRELLRSRSASKWVHAIPVVVLLCFFILWWFSYPVKVVIEDNQIKAIYRIQKEEPGNDTVTDLAILAVSISPITSVPLNFTSNNEFEAPLGSKSG